LETADVAPDRPGGLRRFGRVPFPTAFGRGFRRRCPRCGEGRLVSGYLTMRERCERCGLGFEPYRADDAPAYFTILIVGHLIVAGVLLTEQFFHPESWVQMAIWLPMTLVATLLLLPFVKGAVIATIWNSRQEG
jgi:uncharacterized protein (DUF983 family)